MRSYLLALLSLALVGLSGCTGKTTSSLAFGKCGNNVIDSGEECDGTALGGATCSGTGSVACTAQCRFDDSGCAGVIMICGDGLITGTENCEGTDLGGETCSSIGLATGDLACHEDCTFDVSSCTGSAICPNGEREYPEECDGTDLAGEDCASRGFADGTLACLGNCTFDTSGCNPLPDCGNNTREGSEVCDGTDLDDEDCASLGLGSGTLACAGDCSAFVTSGCSGVPICPNGVREYPEECDGTDLAGEDCDSLGFVGGTLACTGTCTFDTTDCVPNADPSCTPDPIATQVDEGGGPLVITFSCTDVDGQSLALSATGVLPDGVVIANDGPGTTVQVTITLDPDNNDAGPTGSSTFDASFTIEDTLGGTVTVTQNITFDNPGPTADAGVDFTGAPGQTIALDGTGSTDPDSDALTYAWTAVSSAPALDDSTSPTPTFVGGACNEEYTYELVVSDGLVDSAPDTVVVTMADGGVLVSVSDCTPADECGDLTKPWCTIQAGYNAAVAVGAPQVFVKEGLYAQGAAGTVTDDLIFDASGNPEILGGYTDLATMARQATASCELATPGATVVEVTTSEGVRFEAGNTSLFERFCIISDVSASIDSTGRLISIDGASPNIRDNILDASSSGVFAHSIGIEISNNIASSSITPVIRDNRDDTPNGRYFGGDGVATSTGIAVNGIVTLDLRDNVIDGGLGGTETYGLSFVGSGSINAQDNVLFGGSGANSTHGIWAESTGVEFSASLHRNVVIGGTSDLARGAYFASLSSLTISESNSITGQTTGGITGEGLRLDSVVMTTVRSSNTIKGGPVSGAAYGIVAALGNSLTITGNNTVRGGSVSGISGITSLIGISATSISRLEVSDGNAVSGADTDGGPLIVGGLTTIGLQANQVTTVSITNNPEILGGGPRGPAGGPVAIAYRAAGVEIRQPDVLLVEGNVLIQGCSPLCGPGQGASIIPTPATGVGISIDAVAGNGTGEKVVQNNGEIRGGPTAGGPAGANQTLVVGLEVLGPRAGEGPSVSVEQNRLIVGNDSEDDPISGSRRAATAIGVRIRHASVTVQENTEVIGGRAFGLSYGIQLLQGVDVRTAGFILQNGVIYGNPYPDDGAELPGEVKGIEFVTSVASGNSRLEVAGAVDAHQEIGGGQARPDAQGAAVGLDAYNLGSIDVRYNDIWGGVVPSGLVQIGANVSQMHGEAMVDSNLIEACGVGDPSLGLHDPDCDDLVTRSTGLLVLDLLSSETWVVNNLIFGGFSRQGSNGVTVVDSGASAGGVLLYHNTINAQGPVTSACAPGSPDARAISIEPGPGGIAGGGLIEIINNILDSGGRSCTRYGIHEYQTGAGTTFDGIIGAHNAFVQVNNDRDMPGTVWAYRESDGDLFCEAGASTIAPGDCLDEPPTLSVSTSYFDNQEGDPEFVGNDTTMSELPSELSLSEFGVAATVLQGTGLGGLGVGVDYMGDARSNPPDIGHDE